VLPLHHEATREKIKTDTYRCKSGAVALVRDLIVADALCPVDGDGNNDGS